MFLRFRFINSNIFIVTIFISLVVFLFFIDISTDITYKFVIFYYTIGRYQQTLSNEVGLHCMYVYTFLNLNIVIILYFEL